MLRRALIRFESEFRAQNGVKNHCFGIKNSAKSWVDKEIKGGVLRGTKRHRKKRPRTTWGRGCIRSAGERAAGEGC